MKRQESDPKNTRSKSSLTETTPVIPVSAWSRSSIALCFDSGGQADLEAGKVYRVVCDSDALRSGMVRIIDNTGQDYLYPSDWFVPLNLTKLSKSVLIARNSDLFPNPERIAKSPKPKTGKTSKSEIASHKDRQPKPTTVVKHRTS